MTSIAAAADGGGGGGYVNIIEMTRFDHDDIEHQCSTIHANTTTLQPSQQHAYVYH